MGLEPYLNASLAIKMPLFLTFLTPFCSLCPAPFPAATRPAAWTPEALHAVAALLASNVAQAAAVLGEALPALHAATNISQVVAALGAAAAGEADKIAHVCGQVRVAFVHQQVTDQG